MAIRCVNINSPEFKSLLERSGMDSYDLELAISEWQEARNTDDFPDPNNMTAPNGKPSKLFKDLSEVADNPMEAYLRVYSPQFRAWFGDWVNSPENASKVVDDNGEPKIVYHGSPAYGFREFSNEKLGSATGARSAKEGFFFATNRAASRVYVKQAFRNLIYNTRIFNKARLDTSNFYGDSDIVLLEQKLEEDLERFEKKERERQEHTILIYQSGLNDLVGKEKEKLQDHINKLISTYKKKYSNADRLERNLAVLRRTTLLGKAVNEFLRGESDLKSELPSEYFMYEIFKKSLSRGGELDKDELEYVKEIDKVIEEDARNYDQFIYPVFIVSKNPKIYDYGGQRKRITGYTELIKDAKDQNKDGVLINNTYDPTPTDLVIVFEPNQIKSVSNVGIFSKAIDDIYYQLDEKPGVVDTTIREKILEILNRNGISVTTMNEYIENYGLRKPEGSVVNALTDTMRQIVAVDENLENAGTLAEEAGHIVVATQVDTPAFNRAMRLVEDTEEYKANYDKYSKAYAAQGLKKGALERKVKMEILGKLMKTSLFNNLSETTEGTGIRRYLRRMWDNFMKLLQPAKAELQSILDKWSKDFVSGATGKVANEGVFFELGEEEVLSEGEKVYNKLLKQLRERADFYRNIGWDVTNLNKEYWDLYDTAYTEGIFKFLNYAKEDVKKTEAAIAKFRSGENEFTSVSYRKMKLLFEHYSSTLKGLISYIDEGAEELTSEQRKKLRKSVDKLIQKINYIESFHNKMGVKLAVQWAQDHAKATITDPELLAKELALIQDTITEVNFDSNKMLHWFGSLVHAKDSFQRVLYYAVTKIRRGVDRFTYELGKNLVAEAGKLGITDTVKLLETSGGKFTGYIIDKFRNSDFMQDQADFHYALHERYNLPQDWYERFLIKRQWYAALERVEDGSLVKEDLEMAKLIKDYDTEIAQWYNENTVPVDNWQQRIEEKKKQYGGGTSELFKEWKAANVGIGGKGTKWEYEYPKGELATPSDGRVKVKKLANGDVITTVTKDWKNPGFDKLSENEKALRNMLIDIKAKSDAKIPEHRRTHPLLLPQIKASYADMLKAKKLGTIFEHVKDTFKSAEDDTEFGASEEIKRPDGTVAQFVPIYFTKKLENTDAISTDLLSSYILYADVLENYRAMTSKEAQPMFELVLDTIGQRKVDTGKKQYLGVQSEVYKSMEKFIEMNVLGKWKERLEWKGYNISKIMQNLVKFVTANNLAFSLYTTLASYLTSNVYSKIEDLVGQYTNQSNKLFAERIWDTNIHQVLIESGKADKHSKLGLFFEKHHILKSNRNLFDNLDKSRLTRKALDSGLYWSYELVKLRVRGKLALAVADNYKYYNGKFHSTADLKRLGVQDIDKLPNYWDKVEVRNGKLVSLHNDPDIEDRIEAQVEYVGNNIDGELSYSDWAAAHQSALGQLVTTHRGWLFRNVQLRFKPKGVNYQTGQEEAGFYVNFFDFVQRTFLSKERVTSIKGMLAAWETLSPAEKYGVKRTIWETSFMFAIASLALILNNLAADDDEDDSMIQYLAYMSNRVLLEVGAMNPLPVLALDPVSGDFAIRPPLLSNVQEIVAILNSPVAAARQVDDLMDIMSVFSSEEIEQGPYKGMTKRERLFIKMTPGLKGLYQARDPKSRNQYLLNKTLTWMDIE